MIRVFRRAPIVGAFSVLLALGLIQTLAAPATATTRDRTTTTTFTAAFSGSFESDRGPEPGCRDFQSNDLAVTGELPIRRAVPTWHVAMLTFNDNTCVSHPDTRTVDEALERGEFTMSRNLRYAKLDADVSIVYGPPDPQTIPGHLTVAWTGKGRVIRSVDVTTGSGGCTVTTTWRRAAVLDPASLSGFFPWYLSEPPTIYLEAKRVSTRR